MNETKSSSPRSAVVKDEIGASDNEVKAETGSFATSTVSDDDGGTKSLPVLDVGEEKEIEMDKRVPAAAMNGSTPRNIKGRKAMLQRNLGKGKKHQRFDSVRWATIVHSEICISSPTRVIIPFCNFSVV